MNSTAVHLALLIRVVHRMRVVIAGCVLLSLGPAPSDAQETWREVTTPHFVVTSNAGGRTARQVARDLERIRWALQMVLPKLRTEERPLSVVAVKDQETLRSLLPEYWERADGVLPAGVFRPNAYGPEIALNATVTREGAYPIVYHEYYHYLSSLNMPGLPSWLEEGLAEFWENTTVRDDVIKLGMPSPTHHRTLGGFGRFSLEELLTMNTGSIERRRVSMFYAQSWALSHYLMLGDNGARQPSLLQYMRLLWEGEDSLTAATAAFGDLDDLDDRLREYVRRLLFPVAEMRVVDEFDADAFEMRELSEAEALAFQGRFIANGGLPERAAPFLRGALDRDDAHPMAAEGMGVLELRRGHREDAREWLSLAVASLDAGPVAHLLYALLTSDVEERQVHLLKAVAVDPGFAPAFTELAFHYGARDATVSQAVAMAHAAAALRPGGPMDRLLVGRALARAGRREDARPHVVRAVDLSLRRTHGGESNNVCWFGSLTGFPELVMPACEFAVRTQPDSPAFRDSRGVARAMMGDYDGAIEDFQAFVDAFEAEPPSDDARARAEWIEQLKRGHDPFDDETVAQLRGRPF